MLKLFRKLFGKRYYWMCRYRVLMPGAKSAIECGAFPIVRESKDEALEDATNTLQRWCRYPQDVEIRFTISKPDLIDRLNDNLYL